MDTKKIDEFTVMLHKCVSDRDESRKALLKAEDFEGQWQFQKNCKAIIDRDMKREDVQVRYNSACLEDNKSLRDQNFIEFMICDYVVKMNKLVEDLRTELKGQRRKYEDDARKLENIPDAVHSSEPPLRYVMIKDTYHIYIKTYNYVFLLDILKEGYNDGAHNAHIGDVGHIIAELKDEMVYAVRLCKDQSIIIIHEHGMKRISL